MMLVRFGDLSQSDCSKWVMWQVKDPQPRPGWDVDCFTSHVTNDLGSSPQPSGFALGLWWASQVVGDATMTSILVSIPISTSCKNVFHLKNFELLYCMLLLRHDSLTGIMVRSKSRSCLTLLCRRKTWWVVNLWRSVIVIFQLRLNAVVCFLLWYSKIRAPVLVQQPNAFPIGTCVNIMTSWRGVQTVVALLSFCEEYPPCSHRWILPSKGTWIQSFDVFVLHYDVITWKLFPRYWPFVRGIYWSTVNSPLKGPVMQNLMFLWCGPHKLLYKQSINGRFHCILADRSRQAPRGSTHRGEAMNISMIDFQ